ncbi:MAG: putative peptidoglycan glycosyltransferase FtsW [Myxococcota bacterium]|jgi:cell division protein FtsW|nr:putative peptidoglycan glycosyltransferase FtsW [Myxococcota bacterium]
MSSEALGRTWSPSSDEESCFGIRSSSASLPVVAEPQGYDRLLLLLVLVAMGFGVVMVYSASLIREGVAVDAAGVMRLTGNSEALLLRTVLNVLVGLGALVLALKIPVGWYHRHAYLLLTLAILLLAGLIPFGTTVNNSTRWYNLGFFRFQPSELAKLVFIIYVSFSMVKKARKIRNFSTGFFPHLVVLGVLVMFCLKQPDLGTSAMLGGIMILMLLVGGTRFLNVVIVSAFVIPLLGYIISMSDMRVNRILVFLDPWRYCDKPYGYHLCQSLEGVVTGGVTGQGLGLGAKKLFFLPEAHTDFIMAIGTQELGLLGLAGVVLLFVLIGWRGLRIAYRATSLFERFLAFGLTLQLVLQASVNLGVITGVLPTKGLTLPFISYGGSSMLFSAFSVGILLRISMGLPLVEKLPPTRVPPGAGPLRRLRMRLWEAIR